MNFRETLEEHLRAIQQRDLPALRATLPDDELVLIMADGRLVRSVAEFLELHRGWFEATTWTLGVEPVSVREGPDLGVAVLHLDYHDTPADGRPIHETSYLTLVFARQGDRWVMVQDQNTPIKRPAG
jgi:ketosteroid isomerase-like protein